MRRNLPGIDPPESEVLRGCLQLLAMRGVFCWRHNVGAYAYTHGGQRRYVRYGFPGQSDILGVLPGSGRFLAVECKRPGGKPTVAQRAFLAAVEHAGGVALLVDDVAQLDEMLRPHLGG